MFESAFDLLLSSFGMFTVVSQLYVIAIAIKISPKEMCDYRILICMSMLYDICFTFVFVFGLDLKNMFPFCIGMHVTGFFKLFGLNGGNIGTAIMIALFFLVLHSQLYCLVYRFSVIQKRWPLLDKKLVSARGLIISTILSWFEAILFSLGLYNEFLAPPMVADGCPLSLIIFFAGTIGGIIEIAAVLISVSIIRLLRKNVHAFSAKTYRLHRQLIILLLIQMTTPFMLVIIPVAYFYISMITFRNVTSLEGDLGLIIFTFYPLVTSLLTITFVTPYRSFTIRLMTCRLRRSPEENVANSGNEMVRQRWKRAVVSAIASSRVNNEDAEKNAFNDNKNQPVHNQKHHEHAQLHMNRFLAIPTSSLNNSQQHIEEKQHQEQPNTVAAEQISIPVNYELKQVHDEGKIKEGLKFEEAKEENETAF